MLEEWAPRGLTPNPKSDRGVAGYRNLVDAAAAQFPMKTIGPSYSGQSNALVEAVHPKDVQLDGPPSYVQSDKSVAQLIKKEVMRAKLHNMTADISPRLDNALIDVFHAKRWSMTPNHLWQYYEEMSWSAARQLSLQDAVRAFWTPMEFTVDKDGVRFRHWHFSSQLFKDSGLQDLLKREVTLRVKGYYLSAVFRYIWIEVRGRLIEVEATARVPIDGEDLMVPISAVVDAAEKLRQLQSRTRNNRDAATAEVHAQFAQATGKKWEDGERKGGRPKKKRGVAAHEAAVMRGTPNKVRAA